MSKVIDTQTGKKIVEKHLVGGRPSDVGAEASDRQEQCLKDWNRDRRMIFINGQSVDEIYKAEGYTEKKDEKIVSKDISEEQLIGIWNKYIISNLPEEERDIMLNHMAKFMHQGGYLNIMLASLIAHSAEINNKDVDQGFSVISNENIGNRRFDIDILDDKISMKDSFDVVSLYSGKESKYIKNGNESKFMSAKSEILLGYEYDDEASTKIPKCLKVNVALDHYSDITRKNFDQRSILRKIEDFLKSIFKSEKKDILHKGNAVITMPINVTKDWDGHPGLSM